MVDSSYLVPMQYSSVLAVSANGTLIYVSEGKTYQVVGGSEGQLNLRQLN